MIDIAKIVRPIYGRGTIASLSSLPHHIVMWLRSPLFHLQLPKNHQSAKLLSARPGVRSRNKTGVGMGTVGNGTWNLSVHNTIVNKGMPITRS